MHCFFFFLLLLFLSLFYNSIINFIVPKSVIKTFCFMHNLHKMSFPQCKTHPFIINTNTYTHKYQIHPHPQHNTKTNRIKSVHIITFKISNKICRNKTKSMFLNTILSRTLNIFIQINIPIRLPGRHFYLYSKPLVVTHSGLYAHTVIKAVTHTVIRCHWHGTLTKRINSPGDYVIFCPFTFITNFFTIR